MKKFIALFIAFTMLVSFSPSVAAGDMSPTPTIEEILSEYHQKAFENETATAAAYSPRTVSDKETLEQETVNTLNAAGYLAYNITSDNYEALEAELQTDFSGMGLDPNYSNIVVISGESSALSPRAAYPAPDAGGGEWFTYTYNGTTYRMRYATVTSSGNPNYRKSSTYDLLSNYSDAFLDRLLEFGATAFLDSLNKYVPIGTILSLLGVPDYANRYATAESQLSYMAATTWTRTFVQVWNDYYGAWINAASVDYVNMLSKVTGLVYDTQIAGYVNREQIEVNKTEYSANYYNYELRKSNAAAGFTGNTIIYDTVGSVEYSYNNTTVAYHSVFLWDQLY